MGLQMRFRSVAGSVLAILVGGLTLIGCYEPPTSIGTAGNTSPPASVVGPYHASKLTLSQGSANTDMLAAGTRISIVLTDSGVTTGSIVIPAAYSEAGTEDTLSLLGTYTYDAETGAVVFDQLADTFIRDATWSARGSELHGVFSPGSYTLNATLKRDN